MYFWSLVFLGRNVSPRNDEARAVRILHIGPKKMDRNGHLCPTVTKFEFEQSQTKRQQQSEKKPKILTPFPLLQTSITFLLQEKLFCPSEPRFPCSHTPRRPISMEEMQFYTSHQDPETLAQDLSASRDFDWEKVEPLNQELKDSEVDDEGVEALVDSMLCGSGSRLIPSGFTRSNCTG